MEPDPKQKLEVPALLVLAVLAFTALPARACTIFVLTDTNRALFCNNEDWSDPQTRIWFVPAGKGHYGAVYVGFGNGYAQGGLNTEGLAFDWVAGFTEKWEPDPNLPRVRGSSGQRMLETCATVQDAIAFYRTHREPGFWRAKILVADRTGASVIIGAHDGQLQVEETNRCRGFGYGRRTLEAALAKPPPPTVGEGFKILRDCRQKGQYATKYSNIFDLKSGDIYLYPIPDRDDEVQLNLAAELKKGAHYYEIPRIQERLAGVPRPSPLKPGAKIAEPPGPVVGIGAILAVDEERIVVRGVVPDSPAARKKDLHIGDRILAVAQGTGPAVPVQSTNLAQAVELIRGPAGTTVRLTIVSPGEEDSRARVVGFERAELKLTPKAGGNFDVILVSVPPEKMITVIKVIREVKPGIGLAEAKALVERVPEVILEGANQADADAARKKLEDAGAKVEIR